jgi:tRNA pseudouridine32 synthase / 23S rRNA pseudouridine746 synthase
MIPVIFEDNDVIAIDKPENLATIPTHTAGEETVLSMLSLQYPFKIFVVHRLDKEVSGVMLFAKNAMAHKQLNAQFFSHSIKKTYTLIAHGAMDTDSGIISAPIRLFGSGRMGVDEIKGKESITGFSVISRSSNFSLVNAMPQTGRRHQIRVHFYSTGHPVAGDMHYGDKEKQKNFPRLFMHATSITFSLPSGLSKTVESVVPALFNEFMEKDSSRI